MEKLIREINPEIRIKNESEGIAEFVASDESVDSYREIIRAKGWRFDHFSKNAPVLDSHDYSTIDNLIGKVTNFRVAGNQLIEEIKFAIDVPGNLKARTAWGMLKAGYLKAVSVGFYPVRYITPGGERSLWLQQLKELKLDEANAPRAIYLEQQQIELSLCVIGANPNALAKAYKAGVVTEEDLDALSRDFERRKHLGATAPAPGRAADPTNDQGRRSLIDQINSTLSSIKK